MFKKLLNNIENKGKLCSNFVKYILFVIVLFISHFASAQTGTPISSATTITESGSYYLTANVSYIIVGSTSNTGIVVNLDLNGYNIANSSTSGNGTYLVRNYATLNLTNTNATTSLLNGNNKTISTSGRGIRNETSGTVTVDGNIKITYCKSSSNGAAIYNQHSMTINNGEITDCSSTNAGGGAIINGGTLNINGGTISNCSAKSTGGAIHNQKSCTLTIAGGTVQNCNSGTDGGAIYNNGSFTIANGTIQECYTGSGGNGGAIYNGGSLCSIEGGTIDGCHSYTHGGGIYNASGSTLSMSGGIIKNCYVISSSSGGGGISNYGTVNMTGGKIGVEGAGNSAKRYGGGVRNEKQFNMSGGEIAYNINETYAGGGIANNTGNAIVTLSGNAWIHHNTAYREGGGINCGSGATLNMSDEATISYNVVTNGLPDTGVEDSDYGGGGVGVGHMGSNTFVMSGGHIVHNTCYGNGGGLYMRNSSTGSGSSSLKITGGEIANNHAYLNPDGNCGNGGGVYTNGAVEVIGGIIDNNDCVGTGGGFCLASSSNFDMEGGTVSNNSAGRTGGGLYIGGGKLDMSAGTIASNTSVSDGGGFYVSGGNVEITGGTIHDNEAGKDAMSGNGGGFYANRGNVTISDGLVTDNDAVSGGGVYVDGGNFTFSNGTISDNTATSNGGGAYVSGGIVKFKGNISDNSALNGGGLYLGPGASMEFQGGLIINNQADTTLTTSVIRAKTAYHGGADVPGWGSSVIEGCGGGIYLQSGTSSTKKTTLTFKLDPNDKTFGLYTNRAQKGGDDIVSEGLNTEVILPSVREMQLYGFEGKDATPFWYQDYFYEDKGYYLTNGHAVANDVNYVGRYREMINRFTNEYYNHRIADDLPNLDRIKNYYLCLTLSYNMLDITISAKYLLGHETALFQLVRHGGTEDYKYDVLLRGDCTDSATGKSSRTLRNMPWGTYSIYPNDAWNWPYDKIPPQQNLRLGETGNYEFVFDMNHINGAEIPQHDERQPVKPSGN